MANHTPGPWSYRLNPKSDEAWADEHYQISGAPFGDAAPWIAETYGGLLMGMAEANARLIAAAPSMLALLEKALPIIEAEANDREGTKEDELLQGYWSEMSELANEISAEIDRAKGKEVKHG